MSKQLNDHGRGEGQPRPHRRAGASEHPSSPKSAENENIAKRSDVGMFDLFPEILALVKPTPCNQRDFASIEGGGDSVSERFDVKASASGAQPLLSTLFGVKIVLDAFRETLIFRLQICNNESGEMGYGTRRRKIRTLSTHITVVSATATCWGPDFSHADSRTTRSWNSGGQGRNSSVDLPSSWIIPCVIDIELFLSWFFVLLGSHFQRVFDVNGRNLSGRKF